MLDQQNYRKVILLTGLIVTLIQGGLAMDKECYNPKYSIPSNRFDCFPRGIATQKDCLARGCCLRPLAAGSPEPWCFYPDNYRSYQVDSIEEMTSRNLSLVYKNTRRSPYSDTIEYVRVDVSYETESRLHVKIHDDMNQRYETPYPKMSKQTENISAEKYTVEFSHLQNSNFGFAVVRESTKRVLFDTRNVGGFTMSDQFLQISAKLYSTNIYGLGELRKPFRHNFQGTTTFGVFNHDQVPVLYDNLYGSHPFYLAMEEDGKAHGVLLLNSNALEVVLQPTPAITYRAIGGVLDFYFFLGESPQEVVQQYLELIGKPNLPPYWSLGFHISRYGWKNVSEVETVLQRTVDAGIPLDVLYGDIDIMDRNLGFTYDKVNYATLPEFVDKLHSMGIKYVPIFLPGIDTDEPNYAPFEEGEKLDIFIKHENGALFKGKVWNPGHTAFPDFSHPKAYEYWFSLLQRFHLDVKFDGISINMNEPSNSFDNVISCPDTKWDKPPFIPRIHNPDGKGLKYKSLCMSTQQHIGRHYDVHNLYGITQSEVTQKAITEILQKRPFVLSRSTFVGSGRYANHWTGNVHSDWESLKQSVTDVMLGGIFGMPMVGADICGFIDSTTKELCTRWSQLGAFYPFARNNNGLGNSDQDPASPTMGSDVLEASKKALLLRYSLLPYLYTLMHKANSLGHTVARPMFFEFPNDNTTYGLDSQFLWGSALLIAPVLKEGVTLVEVYLPHGTWYSYPQLDKKWVAPVEGLKVGLDAPLVEIPVLIRGGYTIVTQTPDVTTTKSRLNDFQIVAVLNSDGQSQGDLFWDDGDTTDAEAHNFIQLSVRGACLKSSLRRNMSSSGPMKIGSMKVVGVGQKNIRSVILSISDTRKILPFSLDQTSEILTIDTKDLGVMFEADFEMCWSEKEGSVVQVSRPTINLCQYLRSANNVIQRQKLLNKSARELIERLRQNNISRATVG